jgi:Flp pilus assembly protein TadD
VPAVYNLGAHLVIGGRPEEALGVAQHLLELDAEAMLSHLLHGRVLGSLGRVEEAIAALERAHRLDPSSPVPLQEMAHLYAGAGRVPEARAAYRALLGVLPARPYAKVGVAAVAAAIGERDDALRLLEQAVEARETSLFYVAKCAPFAGLRGDPRFAAIEKRIAADAPAARSSGRS